MKVGLGQLEISQGCITYEDPNTGLYVADPSTSALCSGGELQSPIGLWAAQAEQQVQSIPAPGSVTGNSDTTQSATGLCAALGINCPLNIPSPLSPGTSLLLMALLFGATFLVIEAGKR